jgi:hypothetical protein
VYRTTFVVDSADPAGSKLTASVLSGGSLSVRLNGQPTGVENLTPAFPGPHRNLFSFTLADGFVAGLNTLDFVVDNATTVPNAPGGNSIRITEIRGVGPAVSSGVTLAAQPGSQAVREGSRVAFSCVAQGRPPLSYQWYGENAPISGATGRTLRYNPVTTGGQPANFKVVVRNDEGSVTSQSVVLTVTPDNHPVVAPNRTLVGFSGAPLLLTLSSLWQAATDADGDAVVYVTSDATGINTSSPAEIWQVAATLVYSNTPSFTGTDKFNVVLSDGLADTTVEVSVDVQPELRLQVSFEPAGIVRLAWPEAATVQGFRLLSADAVGSPLTTAVGGTPWTEGTQHVLRVTPSSSARFYRLALP